MKKRMTDREIRERLYDIFPVLVFEEGLSIMEATAFALTFEIGLGPADAAAFTSRLMDKKVRTTDIGSYVARAQAKLMAVKEGEFEMEEPPDSSEPIYEAEDDESADGSRNIFRRCLARCPDSIQSCSVAGESLNLR